MAKCQECGKTTTFGSSRPWSKKTTKRKRSFRLAQIIEKPDMKEVKRLLPNG